MTGLDIALRLVVIGVLLISGGAKLVDRQGSATAMRGFGVPASLIPAGAVALPYVEIALAVGLVFSWTVTWAALGATLMFAAFTVAVARVARADTYLECHCFGQLDSSPITWTTVARNGALTAIAAAIWARAQFSGATSLWETFTWPVAIGIAILLVLGAVLYVTLMLWRAVERLVAVVDRLQVQPVDGTPPPAVEPRSFAQATAGMKLIDTDGRIVSVPSMHTRRQATLFIFASSTCPACIGLLPDIPSWQAAYAHVRLVVVGMGDREAMATAARDAGIERIYFPEEGDFGKAFGVNGIPAGLLVDRDASVRHAIVAGGVAIKGLLDDVRSA